MWSSTEARRSEEELHAPALYPWRTHGKGVVRVKRDWIIPPIRVLENSKQVPEALVQVNMFNQWISSGMKEKVDDISLVFKDNAQAPICGIN